MWGAEGVPHHALVRCADNSDLAGLLKGLLQTDMKATIKVTAGVVTHEYQRKIARRVGNEADTPTRNQFTSDSKNNNSELSQCQHCAMLKIYLQKIFFGLIPGQGHLTLASGAAEGGRLDALVIRHF